MEPKVVTRVGQFVMRGFLVLYATAVVIAGLLVSDGACTVREAVIHSTEGEVRVYEDSSGSRSLGERFIVSPKVNLLVISPGVHGDMQLSYERRAASNGATRLFLAVKYSGQEWHAGRRIRLSIDRRPSLEFEPGTSPGDVETGHMFYDPNPGLEKVFINAIAVPIDAAALRELAQANLAELWMVSPRDTLHALLRPEHIALARALARDTSWTPPSSRK